MTTPPSTAPTDIASPWGGVGRTIDLDGPVHWVDFGGPDEDPEVPEAPPVVLVHGLGGSHLNWVGIAPALAARRRVVAIDLPGFGLTPALGRATSVNHHAALLSRFIHEVLGRPVVLVGNSMGGMVSLALAARYPERVSHLVTMGPGSFINIPTMFGAGDGPTEGLKILFEGYQNPTPAVMKRLVEIMTFSPEFATDELAQLRADAAAARPDHLENFLAGIRAGRGPVSAAATPEEAMSIQAPTLLIHGRDDRVVHFEHSMRLVAMIANSRLVLLNRCGHWAQIEHAAEFNRLVRDFVLNN